MLMAPGDTSGLCCCWGLFSHLLGPLGRVCPDLRSRLKVFGGPVLFKSRSLFSTNSSVKGLLYCSTEQVGSEKLTNSIGLREEGKRQIYSIRMKDTLEIHKRHTSRNMNTREKVTMDCSLLDMTQADNTRYPVWYMIYCGKYVF